MWVGLLRVMINLATSLASYVESKQLLDAGEARGILKGLTYAKNKLDKANRARDAAVNEFDKRDGLPDDDDPNLRD